MAQNGNSRGSTEKSYFPTLASSGRELYSIDSETNTYVLHRSRIEKVLSSVEEKNKDLKIATIGVIGSKNNDHHKIYTDLLLQYLEHRLHTNEKIVETFIRDFDDKCERPTGATNGVYFWPKVYKITSKKLERCRLLILFFDGVADKTLEVLASAICSQIYVFKEAGKHMLELEPELHILRDNFNKTSNVTLRNPITTVIKSENDPPRSFRMFLKDWVDFHLDFFKHKETMFSDWEQLMRYLIKTEDAINAYISGTELDFSMLGLNLKRKLSGKPEAGTNSNLDDATTSHKIVEEDLPLPRIMQAKLSISDLDGNDGPCVPLDPVVVLDNKRDSFTANM